MKKPTLLISTAACALAALGTLNLITAAAPEAKTSAKKNKKEAAATQRDKAKQAPAKPKKKGRAGKLTFKRADLPATRLTGAPASLVHDSFHRDFPVGALDAEGTLWSAYIEHNGKEDVLWLAMETGDGLKPVTAVSSPGIIHHPAVAIGGDGAIWCFWGQTGDDDIVHLHARSRSGDVLGKPATLARSKGSNSFASAGTDAAGRVWVTWQSMRAGEGDIFCRYLDNRSGEWSRELAVTEEPGGDWEPRIAFDKKEDGAWVLYDSSRGNEFNLYLAHVDLEGSVDTHEIAHTPAYEGRGSITPTADGDGFWIAAERGRERWGLDNRQHNDYNGMNAQKRVLFGRFDIASGKFDETSLGSAGFPIEPGSAVNLPTVGLDGEGNPWVAYRYYDTVLWSIALTRFDRDRKRWSAPTSLAGSSFGQDRRACFFTNGDDLKLLWPSDLRTTKRVQVAGVYLAGIDTGAELTDASTQPVAFPDIPREEHLHLSDYTPERPADDRHTWNFAGREYGLYWGDVHRHTDVSNCRTGFDGCIVEHFRYAYDMGKLDFLGTSDHTDIGKPYDPYEWWHNQRLADVFFTPDEFTSMYVYEREQKWPWGHRNVVFAERGGPIVYINRTLYRGSQWQKDYPVKASLDQISPEELWDVLKRSKKKVAVVSHTGATGMGTDWSKYDQIDHAMENVVEIYQGARLSYEGVGAPQPPVEIGRMPLTPEQPLPTERNKAEFGQHAAGVYQNALAQGHNLGVFASSDHLSEHVSYGGVYVKEFTRDGILEALKARRTVAATDKIYLEFSCNGQPMGSIFESSKKPKMTVRIDGTAPIARVTIVRNEENYKVYELRDYEFTTEFTDKKPLPGENRYYVRVEQWDGNMAWASPVWVEYIGE